jgi:hypothetical protein
MKKWILCLMAAFAIQVWAADFTYKYLTVKGSDGKQVSLASQDLKLTFADGQLMATNGDGTQTFELASLASMQFSETESTTGIDKQVAADSQQLNVYTLSGMYVGTFDATSTLDTQLKSGVYVVKQNKKSTKIIVK